VGGPERAAPVIRWPIASIRPSFLVSMCRSSPGPLALIAHDRRSISAMRAAGIPWRQRCGAELRSISAAILPAR
jgi:hypothetical protein